jgi:uncharacterized damage-inducible protein DinB
MAYHPLPMTETLAIPDTRERPSADLDERETLLSFLDYYRETILTKLDGLPPEALTRRLVNSRTTLLGIVKHLIITEQWWFDTVIDGGPTPYEDPDDPDAEWLVSDTDDPTHVVAQYRATCGHSNQIARATSSLDAERRRPDQPERRLTVRWIVVHMLEETARHAGHADILRELIDDRTGY